MCRKAARVPPAAKVAKLGSVGPLASPQGTSTHLGLGKTHPFATQLLMFADLINLSLA